MDDVDAWAAWRERQEFKADIVTAIWHLEMATRARYEAEMIPLPVLPRPGSLGEKLNEMERLDAVDLENAARAEMWGMG